jgi:hypothetical protein
MTTISNGIITTIIGLAAVYIYRVLEPKSWATMLHSSGLA